MKTAIKEIHGNWDKGFALDKHSVSSTPIGYNQSGHMQFETIRTEVGEALYQLKYRADWAQIEPISSALATEVCPKFPEIGLVIPMAASNHRSRQPVNEIARAVAAKINTPCFENIIVKQNNGQSLKNLNTKEEKLAALEGTLSINDEITNEGKWNVLLIDDLFHTGASLEAACHALRGYRKIKNIYVATCTWR